MKQIYRDFFQLLWMFQLKTRYESFEKSKTIAELIRQSTEDSSEGTTDSVNNYIVYVKLLGGA